MGSGSLGSGSLWITYSKKNETVWTKNWDKSKKTKKRQTKSTNNKSNEKNRNKQKYIKT
jgi:hypothetical protein